MRIVFMGTPEFAVPCLRTLVEGPWQVVGVFTQPDKPKGRGNKVIFSPVKEYALQAGLPVYQPERIRKESVELLKSLDADVFVTAAFGQILSQAILDIPRLGCVNVHPSLLPRHRGSAPINWAILQGDATTGVSTMMMARGVDSGDVLLQTEQPMLPGETAGEMTERLSHVGAALLSETLRRMASGAITRTPQDESRMTYDPMLNKDMGRVDWQRSANEIVNQIHGLNPWPGVSVPWAGGRLKLHRAKVAEGEGAPGEVLRADPKQGLVVACGESAVEIVQLQAPGGKAMLARDYLRGHPMAVGTVWKEENV